MAVDGLLRSAAARLVELVPRRSRPLHPLAGAVVAVTGGARGIGRATAQQLAVRGARVAVGDLDGDGADAVYAASKHAVVGLTEAVRGELRGSGVELTLVLPSAVQTDLVTGVPLGRGLYTVPPEKVAAGIVAALEGGGRDVYVPGAMRLVGAGVAALPRPVLEVVRRVVGDHRALTDLDTGARADYEGRIAEQAAARRDEAAAQESER